jgi:exoribonuclease-2
MIAANGVTARYLEKKGLPSLRRVLHSPKRWDRIVALAAESGDKLPPAPSAAALDAFLTRRRQADPGRFADLSLAVVKLLGSGEYVLEIPGKSIDGHFGLAVRDYTHSTAPNRRFPDLIAQRLLKAALAGARVAVQQRRASALATHCTQQEKQCGQGRTPGAQIGGRAAAGVARRVAVRRDRDGCIDKGTWVRISGPAAEGRVVRGYQGLDVGERVRVQLLDTDVRRGFIDFGANRTGGAKGHSRATQGSIGR